MLLAVVVGALLLGALALAYTYRMTARNDSIRHHPSHLG